jgi:hypothetical protein
MFGKRLTAPTVACYEYQHYKNIHKQKSNEMHLDCLLYHLIPLHVSTGTGHPQGGVIKYQVKLFKNSVIKVKKGGPSIQ